MLISTVAPHCWLLPVRFFRIGSTVTFTMVRHVGSKGGAEPGSTDEIVGLSVA